MQASGVRYSGWRKLQKRARQGYVRLVRSPGAPSEIAGGMAVGLFIAMLPVLQTPLAVGVAEGMRRFFRVPISRLAAVAGVFLTNPLTGPLIYGGAFFLGRPFARHLLPDGALSAAGTKLSLSDLSSAGGFAAEVMASLAIGGVLLGIPTAIAGYFATRALVHRYQTRRVRRARAAATNLTVAA